MQQPIRRIFKRTNTVPAATPINSSKPEALVIDGDEVVGGPPNEDAGCDGGGESITGLKPFLCEIYVEILNIFRKCGFQFLWGPTQLI